MLGETTDTVLTNGGDDSIYSVGVFKNLSLLKIDAGSGDDSVNVFITNDEVNSSLDINGGSGLDFLLIYNSDTDIDLSLYMEHFDSFERYWFTDSSSQTITIDSTDFIEVSGSYLAIIAGDEDTIILPAEAQDDTSLDSDVYDYYVMNDVTIAISDNVLIG